MFETDFVRPEFLEHGSGPHAPRSAGEAIFLLTLRTATWPHRRGLSTSRTPKNFFQHLKKVIWSRNRRFPYGFASYLA